MKSLASDVTELERPASVEVAQEAIARAERGEDVINLGWGEPQFSTPAPIKERLVDALGAGETNYTASAGIEPLRQRIAEKLASENDIRATSDSIVVTPGAKQALFVTLRALLDDGDEVLLPDPAWTSYSRMIRIAGGQPVPVQGKPGNRFVPSATAFQDVAGEETKALILNTPANPTGAVLQSEELSAIADLAKAKDLYIVADEVYEHFTFDGRDHVSIASFPGMADRTVTINGFSKSHAMTGWRIGYLSAPPSIREAALTVHQHLNTCASAFVQHAAIEAYDHMDHLPEVREQYQTNRDLLVEQLDQSVVRPEGAFYCLIDVRDTERDASTFASHLLDDTGVALTPGATYGAATNGFLRASLAIPTDCMEDAVDRMNGWLNK